MTHNRDAFVHSGLIQIGLRLQKARTARGLTLDELARRTGLTKGLLSKIENFRSVPSLPVLATLAQSLSIDMGELVAGIGTPQEETCTLVRAADRAVVDRDEAVGFTHEALFSRLMGGQFLEVFVLSLDPGAKRRLATTDGMQFIYILEGDVRFRHGAEEHTLLAGDALFFDGRVPHVPENAGDTTARILSVYLLQQDS